MMILKILGVCGVLIGAPMVMADSTEPPTSEVVESSSEGTPSEGTPSEGTADIKPDEGTPSETPKDDTPTAPSTTPDKGENTNPAPSDSDSFDWKAWAKEFLSPQVLTTITTLLAFLATIIKLALSLKDAIKQKQLTIDAVNDLVIGNMSKVIPEEIASKLNESMPQIIEYEKKNAEIMTMLCKIVAEQQNGTPESRVAILNLIQELGVVNSKAIADSKEAIAKQEAEKKAKEDAQAKAVADVVKDTESTPSESYDGTTSA